jgi:hypothetical protein
MILSWHLGRRTAKDTLAFILKLRNATVGHFQISTDGWTSYPESIERVFGIDVDFAQYVKVYAAASEGEGRVVDAVLVPKIGMPDYDRICTSHVERTKPHDQDADAPDDAINECFLEEMGEGATQC